MVYSLYRVASLDGGLVTNVSPRLLNQTMGYSKVLNNLDLSDIGIVKKRPGIMPLDLPALPGTCVGLHKFVRLKEGTEQLLAAAGKSIYVYNDTSKTWKVVQGNLSGDPVQFMTYADQVVMVNGTDASMLWDGTIVTKPVDFPICTMVVEWRGRIVAAGIKDEPNLVRLSHAIDPTIWDPEAVDSNAVQFYVGPDDGEPITGIRNTGEGGLLITKPTQLYGIFGYTRQDMTVDLLDTVIGASAHKTIIYTRPNAFFCGTDGVYKYSGSTPEKISDVIQTTWDNDIDLDALNTAAAVLYKRMYLLTLPMKDGSYKTLVYHVDRNRWMGLWDNPVIYSAINVAHNIILVPHGSRILYTIDPHALADNLVPFKAIVKLHELDLEVPERDKSVSNAYLTFLCSDNPYIVNVSYEVDGKSTAGEPFVCEVTGPKGTQVVHRMHIGKTGKFFAFELWNEDNTDFKPLSVSLAAQIQELI